MFTKLSNNKFLTFLATRNMFNLCRYATFGSVVRNFGVTKKLFASTSVLAEKQDPVDSQKRETIKKVKSEKIF